MYLSVPILCTNVITNIFHPKLFFNKNISPIFFFSPNKSKKGPNSMYNSIYMYNRNLRVNLLGQSVFDRSLAESNPKNSFIVVCHFVCSLLKFSSILSCSQVVSFSINLRQVQTCLRHVELYQIVSYYVL